MTNIPAINSFHSCVRTLERPLVYAELWGLHQRMGADFPMLPLSYHSNQAGMMFTPDPPLVIKVGSAEAGYGKIKCDSREQLQDVRSLIALHSDFVTVERYVEGREYDIRIQVVGERLRSFHRRSTVGSWKGNVGSCALEEVDISLYPQYTKWAEAVRPICGGLDIYTVDAIHCDNGKELILDINDSASGFSADNMKEDMGHCAELTLEKLANVRKTKTG